jgi:protein TonB
MSDPMNAPRGNPPPPPPEEQPKSSSPLIWILLLIALVALAWYVYNRNAGNEPISDLTPPAATSDAMTPAPSSPTDDTARSTKSRAPKKVAKAVPRDRNAALINQPTPKYPPEAFRAREEGIVVVKAQVDELGNASNVEVVSRSGSRALDRAAMNEVRRWKFNPAIRNGKTVASSVQVPVEYKLDDAQ